MNENVELNAEGYAILPRKYLKVRHEMNPVKIPEKRKKLNENEFHTLKLIGMISL